MGNDRTVLIVDDEEGIRYGLSRLFIKEGYAVLAFEGGEGALQAAKERAIDIAVVDMRLKGGESGLDLLAALLAEDPDLPVVIVTGYGSIETAVEAMKHGASDYVLKPIDNAALLDIIRRNLEIVRLRKDNSFLKSELMNTVYSHEIVTRDPGFLAVIAKADQVKNSNAPVLISGESGTGKEVLARRIHFSGNRRDGPFVGLNCAALSEDLLLSELFGHERGAFTGATERQLGKFELANKGTLFLDEIGDMALGVQAKLLRVLEESSFDRVGGTKRISVDIRVVAATNRPLNDLIREGRFRNDLYYRIAIVELKLPPLRERRTDIPLLAQFFIERYAARYRKTVTGIAPEVIERWRGYDWPGNVRELQNAVNQAVLLCRGTQIDLEAISATTARAADCPDSFDPEAFRTLKELSAAAAEYYERLRIVRALEASAGNRSRTARDLGVTRKTLAKKIERYGIVQPSRG
jgi:DNA-binding NtrC family response regulator